SARPPPARLATGASRRHPPGAATTDPPHGIRTPPPRFRGDPGEGAPNVPDREGGSGRRELALPLHPLPREGGGRPAGHALTPRERGRTAAAAAGTRRRCVRSACLPW